MDLKYDILTRRTPHPYGAGTVHTGFLARYATLRPQIKGDPPIVTGFSLGSAMAALHAMDQAHNNKRPQFVILFASPRIGDKEFKHCYNEKLYTRTVRIQHPNDLITRLPFSVCGYEHVGKAPVAVTHACSNILCHDLEAIANEL